MGWTSLHEPALWDDEFRSNCYNDYHIFLLLIFGGYMTLKKFIILAGCVILLFSFATVLSAAEHGADIDVFKGIEEIGIVVEETPAGFGFTADDAKKHIYNELSLKIPSLKISTVSYPYIYVIAYCSKEHDIENNCSVEVALRRIVYLPDKTTFIIATVWNRAGLFQNNVTFSDARDQLNWILGIFSRDYKKALVRQN